MAALARQAAAVGAALVTVPAIRWDLTTDSRKAMYNASQSLRVLHGAIQAAHRQSPVEAADRDLVRAVPVHVRPARRLPDGTESIITLCDGVIAAAERLRQSTRLAAERNFRSPDLNVESLRLAAAASVAATDNCTIMLSALAEAPGIAQPHETEAELAQAIGTAIQARDSWLSVAHALGEFTSDVPGDISAEAADAHDLALWTGRLAHAETTWTPAHSPGRQVRPAAELAARPETVAMVGAAVHHASDSLRHLAAVHHQQAQIAARGRRLLVPSGVVATRLPNREPVRPSASVLCPSTHRRLPSCRNRQSAGRSIGRQYRGNDGRFQQNAHSRGRGRAARQPGWIQAERSTESPASGVPRTRLARPDRTLPSRSRRHRPASAQPRRRHRPRRRTVDSRLMRRIATRSKHLIKERQTKADATAIMCNTSRPALTWPDFLPASVLHQRIGTRTMIRI